jgi:hypothetical protein
MHSKLCIHVAIAAAGAGLARFSSGLGRELATPQVVFRCNLQMWKTENKLINTDKKLHRTRSPIQGPGWPVQGWGSRLGRLEGSTGGAARMRLWPGLCSKFVT